MRFFASAFALTAITLMAGMAPAAANDGDDAFFKKITGKWSGPGEIVAGKYKGTKFTCELDGTNPATTTGLTMEGTCRVGVFAQPMKATVARGGASYKGSFLDGADGKGLNITAGNVAGNRATFSLVRKQLNGAMLAKLTGEDAMNVTISVKVDKEMVPVIGMSLKRLDGVSTGSIAKN
ncbi:MAG: hypothetical protein WCC66_13245 [Rhizobiaceae bacterium]